MNSEWVITAAHCVDGIVGKTIIVGIHNKNNYGPTGQDRVALIDS